jgi:predicted transcriptional regulator
MTLMATERANDLRAFRDFADAKLSNGGAEMTLEEALSLWEYENSPEEEREETIEAIQHGLEDMYAGRTKPAEESLRELCRKHGLPEP